MLNDTAITDLTPEDLIQMLDSADDRDTKTMRFVFETSIANLTKLRGKFIEDNQFILDEPEAQEKLKQIDDLVSTFQKCLEVVNFVEPILEGMKK